MDEAQGQKRNQAIVITDANEGNLKHINLVIPKQQLGGIYRAFGIGKIHSGD